jgi:hypothetical protein
MKVLIACEFSGIVREAATLDGMGNCDGNCCSVLLDEAERIEKGT